MGDQMEWIQAYILINVKPGRINMVIENFSALIKPNPGVEVLSADSTTGKFDIIAKIKTKNMGELHNFITIDLQGIDGIISTVTEIVTNEPLNKTVKTMQDSLKSYVLMEVNVGKVNDVLRDLVEVSLRSTVQVSSISCTTGKYDIIALLRSTDVQSLFSFVSEKFQLIDGISSTLTHVVAKEISE